MSKISLTPNASGTGNFTIASPNSNTDRTLTLPDATGTINTSGAVNEVPAGTASAPSIYSTGDTNTGIFFPAADTIGFTEGGAEAMRIDSSGNLQFNSGYGSVATAYGCRAWVNFNGTGTPAIRASGNVSSITDVGQGSYAINFTTAMPDINYSANININYVAQHIQYLNVNNGGTTVAPTTSALTMAIIKYDGSATADASYVNVAIYR